MNRRDFLQTSAAAAASSMVTTRSALAAPAPTNGRAAREYYELRAYRLAPTAEPSALYQYFESTLIPAANTSGVRAVGVFTEPEAKDGKAVWVLLPYKTPDGLAAVSDIPTESPRGSAAANHLDAPTAQKPAFLRIDSWLLRAFAGQPQLAVPAGAAAKTARVFEMRTYESFSERKARKKIDMFNAGEIDLMRSLQLAPVFYGEALAGSDLPHLTYMLCSPDLETHRQRWKEFGQHPTWLKLKNDPQYADTVSKITSRFLVPAACSQI